MFKCNIGQAIQEKGVDPYSFQPKYGVEAGEDMVRLLAHCAPGEEYKSIHPPLEEMEEPECAVREIVELIIPRQRAVIEPGILAGRTIARTGLRGRTVHGQRGMIFDVLRRWALDKETGEIRYVPGRAISPSEITKEIREMYGRGKVTGRKKPSKLNIIEGLKKDIAFKSQNRLLRPLDMIMTLQIKKIAKEMKKKDLFEEMENIEEKYFEGIPTLPEEAKYLRQKEIEGKGTMSIEEAAIRIKKAQSILEDFEKQYGTKISSSVVKYGIRRLLERVVI